MTQKNKKKQTPLIERWKKDSEEEPVKIYKQPTKKEEKELEGSERLKRFIDGLKEKED